MYPLKFENLYFEKLWGARDLEKFRDNMPEGNIGESWDVACHPHGMSVVSNGEFKGIRFDDLINKYGESVVGTKINKGKFPLLIKLLNTSGKLSVQVHPNDEYANRVENEMGKTEAWYVVDCKEGAQIIAGLKEGVTKERLKEAILEGTAEDLMNKISVKKGETYFIKSGLIHTMDEGLIVAEVQQNSDTTYRLYDYNRGRELHIEKALDVIDYKLLGKKSDGIKVKKDGYEITYICACKDFALELYDINETMNDVSDIERFFIYTCVEGLGKIQYGEKEENIKYGDSILIPASLGEYKFKGNLKLLKSFVPDLNKLK